MGEESRQEDAQYSPVNQGTEHIDGLNQGPQMLGHHSKPNGVETPCQGEPPSHTHCLGAFDEVLGCSIAGVEVHQRCGG